MIAIGAMSENRCIGNKGKLPWAPIKEDFRWFRELTLNKRLLVGRKTYDSFGRGFLPKRHILVASNGESWMRADTTIEDWYIVSCGKVTINEIPEEVIVGGGSKIYEFFLPRITEFYITHVSGEYEGDTFMPPFEHLLPTVTSIKEFDGHHVVKYSR